MWFKVEGVMVMLGMTVALQSESNLMWALFVLLLRQRSVPVPPEEQNGFVRGLARSSALVDTSWSSRVESEF